MPTWLLSLARCAQAACLIVAWCAGSALGQEPASPAEAAAKAAPAAESKPAAPSAPAPDAAPPAAAETSAQSPAGGVGTLPPFDLTRLAHPNVADALELSDEQRASVARLINEMATAQDGADPAARADLRRRMDEQLAALLSEGQRAKLATLADTQQKLRFNFRGQKWDEVLDWFARQAGLALVMDQPPAGTFNYSDNRTYSPTEAIDLLNLMLATRGYTLIQRGRLLILADLSKELPVNIIPRVTPEEIAQRGRSEFVSVLFPLGGRPADSVVKEITPLLGQYGTCTALPQTGQLFVTTTAGKMQEISTVITSIPPPQQPKPPPDKPPPPQPKLEVYPVTNIDPAAAVRTLELLFPSAKFQIDDTADQIMAYATPNEQAAIKGAIDQMQANRPPENRPRLEIYPLELANTEELLDQLTQALPSVQATYDTAQGRLLVFAEPKDQEQVRSFVQKLGADLDEGDRQVVVYQPKHFDPTALVTLVKQLMPRAEVAADAALRRVVVSASPANQAMIKALVDQLDAESALEDAPVLQVYPLEQRLDETLLQSLRTLVPKAQLTLSSDGRRLTAVARVVDQTVVKRLVDQWAAVAAEQDEPTLHIYPLKETLTAADVTSLKTLVPAAEATLGPDGRQLRVVARAADHVQIAALLKVLEQAAVAAQQDEPTLKIYPLEETLTATDVASLKTLVPAAEATLGPDGRQLRVVARAADHVQIAALLEQFELAAGAVDKPQLAFYQLDGVSAAQLQTLFQPRVVRSTITVDSAQDRLIVWGPREEHEAFAQIVQQLSQDPLSGTKPELKYYPLPDASLSTSVTTVLTSMAPAAKITWDAATQRLMVIATPKDQQVVRDTLEQVLRDAGPIEPPELRFYPLADGADARFRQLQPDLLTQFPGIRIVEDPDTGELAVWAKASQHAKLAQLLESFRSTSPSTERPVLISYPIQRGSAKAAFDMLKELFPTLKMALDEKKDRVLVSAPLSQHARIKMAIGQVDVETPPESQEELRSYSTGNINPTPLLTMLQSLLPDMQLSADAPAQKIIAWGTVADHEVLSRALEQFREGDPERRPVVKIYPLEGRDYTTLYQLRSVLMQVVPEAVIGVDSRGGAIIVSARAADQTAVETAIKQMVDMDQLTELRLETYTLDKLKATPTLTTLRLLAPPPAQLSVGAVPEQIVVWGTSKDHERIRAALAKLEETGGADAQRELRLHRVRKAASTQAASIIATTLPEVQVLLGQGTEELLIWASPRDHTRLEELIKQLEAELRLDVDRQIKTFELDDVDPAEARRVLDATVGKLEYLTTTVPGRLVVRAEPAALEKVAAVLTELKQVLALPEQVVRVHRYDPDELSVSTLYAALSTADTKELTVQVNPATNSLIVRGPAARQDELAATLSQLALQLPAPDKPIAEVYRLERAEVNTAATVVRSLVPTAVVAVDATNQTLAITTTAKDHTRIKEIIQQLDSSEGGELLTRTYLLKRAYPSGIMTAIKPIVPRAIISPDPYSKSLIVTATAEDHTRIKAIVDEADGLGGGELRTQAYPLQWSSPYAIMTALTPIVPNATLSPDVSSKTLIVTANESDHARVKTVIEQADRRSGGPWTTKAYPLKWANPSTVSSALTSVVPDAKVSSDPVNKMLIVTASAEDHARIDEVLQQADKRGGGGELVTKAYTLRVANPSTIVAALTPVVPNATISSDPTNQMLVATASEDDHVRIQAIIDEADRRKDGELTTEVYALQWANPSALSYSIKPIAPNASVSPDIYNKTLIVTATAKDHARIKAVIDQADRRGGGELLTKAYPLKWANASTISTALTNVVPDAKVSSDPTNKMLVVTASEGDHEKIQAVLDQADKRGGGGELVTKAYTLRVANPSTITAALTPVVPNATISSDPTNQMLIVTAPAEDHQRIQAVIDEADRRKDGELTTEVYALQWANPLALSYSVKPIAPNASVSPDIYNKTLIVTATAKDHARIKTVIDQADRRGGGELLTKAYPLKWANASTISTALTNVVPDAKVSSDPTNKMLIVTASETDHEKIQAVLEQADQRGGGELVTKAYTLRTANPSTIMAALLPVVPDAKISSDVTNQLLIVTASAEDQQRVAAIIEEADQGAAGELVTQVYKLQWANPTALSTSLRPIAPRATLSPDVYNKTLIVTATAQDQARIKPIVEQADRKGEGELSTKVYAFKRANPATVATALTSLLPNATLSSDASTNTLIATATAEDHQTIAPLVEQLDVADPKANVLKPYRVENADPQQVYMSLTELFRTNRNVSIGFQAQTGMILVFAPAADQTEVEQAIRDIDLATVGRPRAVLQVYSLEGLDGESAVATLRRVLLNETPKIELQLDETNNQLLAIADPLQHVMIRQALQQLSPEPRDVEVFTLQRVDPYTASSAISTLFSDLPYAAMPSVEADPNTQQLMIRATKSQLERIEQLLQKMGEGSAPLPGSTQGSILRVLPMSGDVENTLQQIQSLWPRVRGNPLEVLMPPPRRGRAPDQPAPPAPAPNEKDAPKADQTDTPPPPPSPPPPADAPPADAPAEPAPPDAPADAPGDAVTHAGGVPVHFVSMQDEPPAQAAPPAQETPVVVPPQAGDAGAVVIAEEQPAAEPAPLAPIVVIASEGRITIASRDVAALDQFENLWKMLQRGRRVRIEAGNYSMFLLQNADAQQLAEVLEQLFRRGMRGGGGESYRPYFRRSAPLTVVADERMNALLVYGSVADRQAVEEILDVLDSMDLPESLTTPRPRMIPVQNLPANNVLTVLQTVYRTQLSARSGVRPITIPQGISFEMSSMLQLINAAAEAPLLTLDVDLTTNSIVMRAPRQLGEEIEEFIQELDEQAKDGGKRSISLVPLKTMNTSEVQDALQMLMRGGGRYRGR